MGLKIVKEADGDFRRIWYARMTRNGKKIDVRLDVGPIRGTIPVDASGKWDRDAKGDEAFERSREAALKAYAGLKRRAKTTKHELARLNAERRAAVGQSFANAKLATLFDRWLGEYTGEKPTEPRQMFVKKTFADFATFAGDFAFKRGGACETLDDVSREMASAYFERISSSVAWDTAKSRFGILRQSWERWATMRELGNPFGTIRGRPGKRRSDFKSSDGKEKTGRRIPRIPLTLPQLKKLFELVREHDPKLFPLLACVATTGLRIGDAVNLRWDDVEIERDELKRSRGTFGTIQGPEGTGLETSKTGAKVFLPILQPFADELAKLEEKRDARDVHVFPAELARYNDEGRRSHLYDEIKPFFALAVREDDEDAVEDVRESVTLEQLLAAVDAHPFKAEKAERLKKVAREHFAGFNQKAIGEDLGLRKGQVSADIEELGQLVGVDFRAKAKRRRNPLGASKNSLMRETRRTRDVGKNSASVYGWHSLRATYVVLAISAGVPLAVVARAVGHTTTKMTLQYFNPTRRHEVEGLSRALANVYALELKADAAASIQEPAQPKALTAKEVLETLDPEEKKKLLRAALAEAQGLI